VRGFVDLHCHWLPGVDDGARSLDEGRAMLEALAAAGFSRVIATPHLRPGMFDNERDGLIRRYAEVSSQLAGSDLPELGLASEHYFDEVNWARLSRGEGLPYPGERAVLLEFYEIDFPPTITRQIFELRRRGLLPVIAHPERYRCLWKRPEILEGLVEGGAVALLDAAALVGKYGREPRACAEELLERELYQAACSDAHRVADVSEVVAGMERIEQRYGKDEVDYLFSVGPHLILAGQHDG
jgi:protein-tyrosine phosphatase